MRFLTLNFFFIFFGGVFLYIRGGKNGPQIFSYLFTVVIPIRLILIWGPGAHTAPFVKQFLSYQLIPYQSNEKVAQIRKYCRITNKANEETHQ